MNQTEIGDFIAKCRREKELTQAQLAEKLNITDRAVSKWETGKSMPDSAIMLELCDILGIAFLVTIPFMLVINVTLSRMIGEPVVDVWDILSAFILLTAAFSVFVCDYAKNKGFIR